MTVELRNRLENEKEANRSLDNQLAVKFNEFNSLINEEKLKYNESMRALDGQKREILTIIDNERMRTNAMIHDTKDSIVLIANDRIERAKDDIINKIRDLERVIFKLNLLLGCSRGLSEKF